MSQLISKLWPGEEILDPFLSMINKCPVLNTPTDWKETPEAHVFIAELPGLKKEEVTTVEVVDDAGNKVLQISGERPSGGDKDYKEDKDEDKDKDNNNEKWHRVERCRGRFLRRFRLPENAKADEFKASMENGLLTVTIPKQEVKKTERKVVHIEGK